MHPHAHPHAQTLDKFYRAFAALDSATMRSCYAPDVQFQDEVFTLKGRDEVAGMWDMLCSATRAKGLADWKLEYSGIEADDQVGRAHWDAHYLFSATGRKVLNRIDARFTFTPEGLIATHHDSFNFWAWARRGCCWAGAHRCATRCARRRMRICASSWRVEISAKTALCAVISFACSSYFDSNQVRRRRTMLAKPHRPKPLPSSHAQPPSGTGVGTAATAAPLRSAKLAAASSPGADAVTV